MRPARDSQMDIVALLLCVNTAVEEKSDSVNSRGIVSVSLISSSLCLAETLGFDGVEGVEMTVGAAIVNVRHRHRGGAVRTTDN
jgi:hypothetical protein